MLKRAVLLASLGGAVGVPYLMSTSNSLRESLYSKFGQDSTETVPSSTGILGETGYSWQGNQTVAAAPRANLAGAVAPPKNESTKIEVQPIQAVFRFDVTPAWILGNWARVSTSLSDPSHSGYRVALVTGTNPGDLAGALTYYFNHNQQVERIAFQGSTGDARPLVEWLATQHQFVRMVGPDPSVYLYQVQVSGKPVSELRIVPVPVVRQAQPNARFDVSLTMQRSEVRR